MVALRSSLIALVVVLGGCDVGEVPPAGGGPDAGGGVQAQKFDTVIKPLVMRCAIAGCHIATPPQTSQPPNFYSYATLDARYKTGTGASNILVTHVGDGQPHNAVSYLSAMEKMTVASWIDGK